MAYFREIWSVSKSILKGMRLTFSYLINPKKIVTIQYPKEKAIIPPRHRGTHFLETEKCILCYQCSNACPVDCIYIEGSRDGSIVGAHQGKGAVITRFSIDYGLCIYCNLCCEPCPTECIHMGQQFDLVSTSRGDMMNNLLTDKLYSHEDSAFVVEKRKDIDRLAEEKKKAKAVKAKAAAAAKAKKAAEAKAAEAKAAELQDKPTKSKAADAKPKAADAEPKSADTKPAEAKDHSADVTPKPGDAEPKAADDAPPKPADATPKGGEDGPDEPKETER